MKQLLFIHGGDFFDTRAEFLASLKKETIEKADMLPDKVKRWTANLAEDLGKGYEVLRPDMPCAEDAKYAEWKIMFEKAAAFLTGEQGGAILVGHSLGGIFLARYLSENTMKVPLAGVFLVAAPYFNPGKGAKAGFYVKGNFKKLLAQTKGGKKVFLYHSSDDPVVSPSHAKLYSKGMPQAHCAMFSDRGHFRQEHFPELVEEIKKL